MEKMGAVREAHKIIVEPLKVEEEFTAKFDLEEENFVASFLQGHSSLNCTCWSTRNGGGLQNYLDLEVTKMFTCNWIIDTIQYSVGNIRNW